MARHGKALDAGSQADAFSALFRQTYPQIVAFARRRVGPDSGQEIAAETFLVAWRRFDSIPDPPLPWLYQVATFTIANHRRREARSIPVGESAHFDRVAGASHVEHELADTQPIMTAFTSLSERDQEVLRLAAWDGLSSAEGAAVVGCSVTAYKVRLHRARARLGKRLTTPPVPTHATGQPHQAAATPADRPGPLRAAEEPA